MCRKVIQELDKTGESTFSTRALLIQKPDCTSHYDKNVKIMASSYESLFLPTLCTRYWIVQQLIYKSESINEMVYVRNYMLI